MHIKDISLKNFRNYEKLHMTLSPGVNILFGPNAQGKTNFLEALYFCATGRSKRTSVDRDLIRFMESEAHIQMHVAKDGMENRLDVHLRREGGKGIAINGLPVHRLGDLFGALYAVTFSPEDMQLIKEGPGERRRFMDMELCQLSTLYYFELQQYYKILKQRNQLLKQIQKKRDVALRETLCVWDDQLVAHGTAVMERRAAFIERIHIIARDIHSKITNGQETLALQYKPSTAPAEFMARLQKNTDRDIILGSTSVGIHKDDLIFLINDIDARAYGSQGQQRTASLAAKLAEISLIREEKGTDPVLLLDDVLSELDQSRQTYLIEAIQGIQTVITATGVEDILNHMTNHQNISVFSVRNGVISLTNR